VQRVSLASAALATRARQPEATHQLVAFLSSPEVAEVVSSSVRPCEQADIVFALGERRHPIEQPP
jgi:hypothetical protein